MGGDEVAAGRAFRLKPGGMGATLIGSRCYRPYCLVHCFEAHPLLWRRCNYLQFLAEPSVNRCREARVVSPERMLIHNVEGDTL